ncbi:hypothetical protein WG922_17680 [Ramlibacter sp. AN1015]|uniref:hypothetical protein n=1 Tax=Ramlibacter sp. AN1015 TaxID=3133428 RepID=UPI0030BACD79
MTSTGTPPLHGTSDEVRQSVAGEEDPGAAAADAGLRHQSSRSDASLLKKAINRWEDEGGGANQQGNGMSTSASPDEAGLQVDLTNAELVQLQLRVIALENLVIALLAGASEQTSEFARAIASNISPRPGSTPHHLTIRAAAQMVHLLERATISKDAGR